MPETLARPSYEDDFYAWALDQAERLRAQAALRPNEPLDWENLAEEIEGLARSDWRSCASLLEQILAHLLKLAFSTGEAPRAHWLEEVTLFRLQLERIATTTLVNRLRAEFPVCYRNARRIVESSARRYEPALLARLPETCPWTFEQVVGDFFPEPSSAPADRA